jgi:uncharacterized protein YecE (DUF72 family)
MVGRVKSPGALIVVDGRHWQGSTQVAESGAASTTETRAIAFRIGCSGWQYRHWRHRFYPADLPASRWLEYYASRFDTVEINNSFYRLPELETFRQWRRRAPSSFLYAVKASRYLTHMKKLKEPAAPLARFFSRARGLGKHLGPVLYQLPPHWGRNLERLEDFLRQLPKGRRHAVEFRDASWYVDETMVLLNKYRAALCVHDMAGSATGQCEAGPFVYLRMHGPERYGGAYPDDVLQRWAEWCVDRHRRGASVYAYFNNDIDGHAPRDAVRFRSICEHLRRRV